MCICMLCVCMVCAFGVWCTARKLTQHMRMFTFCCKWSVAARTEPNRPHKLCSWLPTHPLTKLSYLHPYTEFLALCKYCITEY